MLDQQHIDEFDHAPKWLTPEIVQQIINDSNDNDISNDDL